MNKILFFKNKKTKKKQGIQEKFKELLDCIAIGGIEKKGVTGKAIFFFKKLLPKNEEIKLLKKAFLFSIEKHKKQKRLSGEPYFMHLFETSKILALKGAETETIAAALLHDVLEDTKVTDKELKKEFGENIYNLVKGLTKIDTLSKERTKLSNEEYIKKIMLATGNDIRIIFLKLADKLHNIRTIHYLPKKKRKQTAKHALEIYVPLAEKFGLTNIKNEIGLICTSVLCPKKFNDFCLKLEKINKKKQKELKEVKAKLLKKAKKFRIKAEISIQQKHPFTVWSKSIKTEKKLSQLYDTSIIEVIVQNPKDCYHALELVHSTFFPIPKKLKDYISTTRHISRQGLHTTILSHKGNPVKIYILTKKMKLIETHGVFYWYLNKEKEKLDAIIKEIIKIEENKAKKGDFITMLKNEYLETKNFVFYKSRIYLVPEKITLLDFVYRRYPEKAAKTKWIKVNEQKANFWEEIEAGSIIKIGFSNKKTVSPEWLDYVNTLSSKRRIQHQIRVKPFKNEEKKEFLVAGTVKSIEKLCLMQKIAGNKISKMSFKKCSEKKCYEFKFVLNSKKTEIKKIKKQLTQKRLVSTLKIT